MADINIKDLMDSLRSSNSAAVLDKLPAPKRTVIDEAKDAYPILGKYDVEYAYKPEGVNRTGQLEFYPAGETDRPKQFALQKPGVAVFDDSVRAQDILGDVVSHYLVSIDPTLKESYGGFEKSLTTEQKKMIRQRYKDEGDKRTYEQWYKTSGLPTFYRGYIFDQLDEGDFRYTPEQIKSFDKTKEYLGIAPKQIPSATPKATK